MAHEHPRQVFRDLESLGAGGGKRLRQRLLPDHGHVEAVLDIIFLAHRVDYGLTILVERPAKYPGDDRPQRDAWLRRTTSPLGVLLDDRHDLAVVVDIGELLTGKIHVALGGEELLRVGKLGVALPGV